MKRFEHMENWKKIYIYTEGRWKKLEKGVTLKRNGRTRFKNLLSKGTRVFKMLKLSHQKIGVNGRGLRIEEDDAR